MCNLPAAVPFYASFSIACGGAGGAGLASASCVLVAAAARTRRAIERALLIVL